MCGIDGYVGEHAPRIDALHADLHASGVRFRSDGPVEMLSGPNRGGKSLYSLDPDGYVFEFHERPPHVD